MVPDHVEAAKWMRKAADQGDSTAQESLGLMYHRGDGVPQDYVLAHMWSILAVAQGAKPANWRGTSATIGASAIC